MAKVMNNNNCNTVMNRHTDDEEKEDECDTFSDNIGLYYEYARSLTSKRRNATCLKLFTEETMEGYKDILITMAILDWV